MSGRIRAHHHPTRADSCATSGTSTAALLYPGTPGHAAGNEAYLSVGVFVRALAVPHVVHILAVVRLAVRPAVQPPPMLAVLGKAPLVVPPVRPLPTRKIKGRSE